MSAPGVPKVDTSPKQDQLPASTGVVDACAGEEVDASAWLEQTSTPVSQPEQKFRYAVVMDFEATCFEDKGVKLKALQEIIEFPAVIIDLNAPPDAPPLAEFHRYVQPTDIPKLSDFCTKLTGIRQEMVDGHATIDAVLRDFIAWIEAQPYLIKHSEVRESVVQILRSTGARGWDACHLPQKDAVVLVSANVGKNFVICTCGDWDFKTMFPTEIKRKKLDGLVPRWLKAGWCNVKVYFESCTGTKARGMPGMLDSLRLPLIGRHHSGIDDTRNIANIVKKLVNQWGDPVDITHPPARAWAE